MGIHSRDYIREVPSGGGGFHVPGTHWAIKYLLIANVAVYVLQYVTNESPIPRILIGGATGWLSLNLSDVFPTFQIWRLVTYGFCHGGLQHLLFNMFVLWMFGRIVEPIYGSREFLAFYIVGVVVSGLGHLLMQVVQQSPASVIGASGGVMAVVFLTAMIYPRMQVLLFFVLPIQLRWLAVGYAAMDVMGVFDTRSGVAHVAHLGGAAFGVAYKYYGWRIVPWWDRLRQRFRMTTIRRKRPDVRLFEPSQEKVSQADLERDVDAILAKISQSGEASLTDKERRILKDASQRYKKH
jgi:membrane associated rhomboid family serine protease